MLLGMRRGNPAILYEKAMSIIKSDDRFAGIIYPSDRHVPQVDLYKIHHFDNKARTTSLKALEFNMRMDNISDLPFPSAPGSTGNRSPCCASTTRTMSLPPSSSITSQWSRSGSGSN